MNYLFRRHFVSTVLLLIFSSLTASITLIAYQEIIANPVQLPAADELVLLGGTGEEPGMPWPEGWNSGAFSKLSVFQTVNLSIGDTVHQETVLACLADVPFFRVLAISPEHGRLLNEEDTQAGALPVAVVSDAFWRSHLGSTEDLSNVKFYAAGHWFGVVGVLSAKVDFPAHSAIYLPRPDHRFTFDTSDAEHWSPDDISRGTDKVLGRLRPGVTLAQARGMENVLLERIRKANTDPHHGVGSIVTVRRLGDSMTLGVKNPLTIMGLAGCFVALVALFSLLLLSAARAAELRKDMAIRVALGATTSSLLWREVLWWLWVGLSSSVAVLICTELLLRSGRNMEGLAIPRLGELSLSFPQAVCIVAGTIAIAVFLALPYLFACLRTEPITPVLNRGESQTRLTVGPAIGRVVSVGQLSLALALTAIALHVCVNYWRLATTAHGINPSGVFVSQPVLTSSLNLGNLTSLSTAPDSVPASARNSKASPSGAAAGTSLTPNTGRNVSSPPAKAPQRAANPSSPHLGSSATPLRVSGSASIPSGGLFQPALKEESQMDRTARGYILEQEVSRAATDAGHQPRVASVALIDPIPYESGAGTGQFVKVSGKESEIALPVYFVRGDVPKTLGVRVLAGRWFDNDDEKSGADVIVVGNIFSKQYFSGKATGERVWLENEAGPRTIVGVVDDVVADYGEEIGPTMYIPLNSQSEGISQPSIVVKMALGVTRPPFPLPKSPGSLVEFQPWVSMEKMMSDAGATDRASAMVAAWLAALVLLLAAAGAYAIFWMLTIQRQREMAIRICFGALPWKVAMGMLVNGITLAAYAGVGGFVIQQALQRVLSSSIYKFPAFSWPIFLISFGVISVATLLSVAQPARSILRLSPTELLRDN